MMTNKKLSNAIFLTAITIFSSGIFMVACNSSKKANATAPAKTTAKNNSRKKPNIIVILADDISAREFPVYGSNVWSKPGGGNTTDPALRANTPVITSIAEKGCYIKNAWASIICSPSRAMIMTGRYAHVTKWWFNTDIGTYTDDNGKKQGWPLYESSPFTFDAIAKAGGYKTFWAGKTQMKGTVKDFSFDEGCFTPGEENGGERSNTDFVLTQDKSSGEKKLTNENTGKPVDGSYAQTGWYWKPGVLLMNTVNGTHQTNWWPNTAASKKEYGLNTYGPDVELNAVFDFMTRKVDADEPFFVYHASHLGHDAFDFLHPENGNNWPGAPVVKWQNGKYVRTPTNITGSNGVYDTHGTVTEPGIHNQINYLDYQVSLYLQKLKDLKIEDNTILIFCADNGTWGYGKGNFTQQRGTQVPLIVYAPGFGLTKQGPQDVLADLADIVPTIAEITGVKIPASYETNGSSLWPFLTTNATTHRSWVYSYAKDGQFIRSQTLLKDGKDNWWDVSTMPADFTSFPAIKDWSTATPAQQAEKKRLEAILPPFNKFATEHDAPADWRKRKPTKDMLQMAND